MTIQKIISEAKRKVPLISAEKLYKMLENTDEKVVVLDIREKEEVEKGTIPTAVYIPRSYLELEVERVIPNKDTKIVTYCATGVRSLIFAKFLKDIGFKNVYNLEGGYNRWIAQNFPVTKKDSANNNENLQGGYFYRRYLRHFRIPEIGESGQKKLQNSKVLVIGAGGLGCPFLIYLAAAGTGTLGIVDNDIVNESDLHRQILHFSSFINRPKIESAYFTLKNINPYINIQTYQLRLNKENVLDIFKEYDVIMDGTDNFATRYLVNDACVFLKKPFIHGSIFRFEGQLTSFYPGKTACYRCIYPEPPLPDFVPNCQDAGVLGVLPGVIGILGATEAIKIILNIGKILFNKLLYYNAITNTFKTFNIQKNNNCLICGEKSTIKELVEYKELCSQS